MALSGIRVLSNYTGGYHASEPESIKARLFFQLFHPVLWFDNLQCLLQDGVAVFIEFGGGIGSGETPAAKRPNLEGMLKKAMRGTDSNAQYFPVINTRTLQETAAALLKMG